MKVQNGGGEIGEVLDATAIKVSRERVSDRRLLGERLTSSFWSNASSFFLRC